jgi:hypothetical protein
MFSLSESCCGEAEMQAQDQRQFLQYERSCADSELGKPVSVTKVAG